ncbi:hypothetical protein FPV67DRAFT_1760547 [Lyophyllum atratum]|nr:hypothetical protein FPV67DRAFT_1760547 [Lyophyllum atratum]
MSKNMSQQRKMRGESEETCDIAATISPSDKELCSAQSSLMEEIQDSWDKRTDLMDEVQDVRDERISSGKEVEDLRDRCTRSKEEMVDLWGRCTMFKVVIERLCDRYTWPAELEDHVWDMRSNFQEAMEVLAEGTRNVETSLDFLDLQVKLWKATEEKDCLARELDMMRGNNSLLLDALRGSRCLGCSSSLQDRWKTEGWCWHQILRRTLAEKTAAALISKYGWSSPVLDGESFEDWSTRTRYPGWTMIPDVVRSAKFQGNRVAHTASREQMRSMIGLVGVEDAEGDILQEMFNIVDEEMGWDDLDDEYYY